ncbi:hypothetical protein [Rhizobium sp. Root482]|uniref:hypothetical protein n=1 Tax=Rhizobium sp. Root482 TaxID=1736543 RepID=UPI00070197C6|nr:hypothetical protein [Rhizobium sp. Root482]KQY20057.1 hypothetical protein ASD31_06700 [Rhizobium sp. Root482]
MKTENQKLIRDAYPDLCDASIGQMPDGWTEIIITFITGFHDLGEDMMSPGEVRFERTNSGLKAFILVNPEMQLSPEKAQAAIGLQRHLHFSSRQTCEWCGKPAEPVELGDRVTIFLCEEDATSAREKLAAKVHAFDERVKFRAEVSMLFQEHANVWLQVSDPNTAILRKALLDIKSIVEERDLIGKVYVTKIMESEGQLFINVRCDQADPATQFEIADIIKHAEWESDQASLAVNKEGRDDDP